MAAVEHVLIHADVVYNGLGTPRHDAAVVVERAQGRDQIVAVDDLASLRRAYRQAVELDAGFAIAPRPVNAHTHFDLSSMPLTEGSYEDFVRSVIAHGRAGERGLEAVRRGVEETLAAGVRTVGDIVTTADGMRYLLEHPELQGVAYWEVVGPDPAAADRIFGETVERLRTFRSWQRSGGVRVGLSPHSAHTVSAPLLRRLAALAQGNGLALQIHLAESPGERQLFLAGTGPLAELLRGAGLPVPTAGVSPVRYLADLGVLAARPTLVHMVEVDEDDVRLVQREDCSVVHCPRSNAALGCARFPWELYARHGATVAIGTDSRGSSPTLSPLDDVAAARALHGDRAAGVGLVRAAVKGGHRVLQVDPPIVRRGDDASALTVWTGAGAVDLGVYTAQHTNSADLA